MSIRGLTPGILYKYRLSFYSILATPSILPARLPPLFPERAVESRFSQFPVYIIVCIAEPLSKLIAAARSHGFFLQISLEVLSADPAGVEFCEQPDEIPDVGLLARGGSSRILRCYRVEKGPRTPTEGLNVRGAVFWWCRCFVGLEG